jgi:hypothetical protein
MSLADLKSEVRRLRRRLKTRDSDKRDYRSYADDPVAYAKDVLGIKYIWSTMEEAALAALLPPHRLMLISGHKVGKSLFLAWMGNWFYDSFPESKTTIVGPSFDSANDIVFAELREQRETAGLPGLLPKAPILTDGPGHILKLVATNSGERFQGRHGANRMVEFDEGCGIDAMFWRVARTMVKPEPGHIWIVALNPTDITSQAYIEAQALARDGKPKWKIFTLDCLKHPNIIAQINGEPPPIPAAVTMPLIDDWLEAYACDRISADQATSDDLQWPPGARDGKGELIWYRQSAEFLARCRGRWPTESVFSLWSESTWQAACDLDLEFPIGILPQIGIDVARFGDDKTAFHVRCHHTSLEHCGQNSGWSTDKTADYAKSLAIRWAAEMTEQWANVQSGMDPIDPKTIPIKIDDDGVGGGVTDNLRAAGYRVYPITAQTRAKGKYPNRRSELWFTTRDQARKGRLSLKRIPNTDLGRMKVQAIAVEWGMQGDLRVVMPKEAMKEKTGRSPDDLDAMNNAYAEESGWAHAEQPQPAERPKRRGVFG